MPSVFAALSLISPIRLGGAATLKLLVDRQTRPFFLLWPTAEDRGLCGWFTPTSCARRVEEIVALERAWQNCEGSTSLGKKGYGPAQPPLSRPLSFNIYFVKKSRTLHCGPICAPIIWRDVTPCLKLGEFDVAKLVFANFKNVSWNPRNGRSAIISGQCVYRSDG